MWAHFLTPTRSSASSCPGGPSRLRLATAQQTQNKIKGPFDRGCKLTYLELSTGKDKRVIVREEFDLSLLPWLLVPLSVVIFFFLYDFSAHFDLRQSSIIFVCLTIILNVDLLVVCLGYDIRREEWRTFKLSCKNLYLSLSCCLSSLRDESRPRNRVERHGQTVVEKKEIKTSGFLVVCDIRRGGLKDVLFLCQTRNSCVLVSKY
jgi:hypothetical protein